MEDLAQDYGRFLENNTPSSTFHFLLITPCFKKQYYAYRDTRRRISIIIANCEHRFLVAEQCRDIGLNNPTIILEPEGKNTAPAIVAGALQAQNKFENCHLLIYPLIIILKILQNFIKR